LYISVRDLLARIDYYTESYNMIAETLLSYIETDLAPYYNVNYDIELADVDKRIEENNNEIKKLKEINAKETKTTIFIHTKPVIMTLNRIGMSNING